MISLSTLDYTIIVLFFTITLCIGVYVSKKSGENSSEFFLSGRTMPWWLLGVSMVATTFSTDTPNLVTDIVRTNGFHLFFNPSISSSSFAPFVFLINCACLIASALVKTFTTGRTS